MFTRRYPVPDHSFFLLGPRGTGKSTWLRQVLPDALWFDLLRTHTLLALTRQPESFRQQVEARPRGSWVVVDEVQRLPSLLNEVHALIAETGRKYRFALSGSSARKLKRLDVNLLAGRAVNRQFFPLTAAELDYDFDVEHGHELRRRNLGDGRRQPADRNREGPPESAVPDGRADFRHRPPPAADDRAVNKIKN